MRPNSYRRLSLDSFAHTIIVTAECKLNSTVTLAISANSSPGCTAVGSYVFNVTGTVGSLSHSTTVTVTVTALPPALTSNGSFSTALVAGTVVSLAPLLSSTPFLDEAKGC